MIQKSMFSFFSRASNPAATTSKNKKSIDNNKINSETKETSSPNENKNTSNTLPEKPNSPVKSGNQSTDESIALDSKVGRRIRVFWPQDKAWYPGRVDAYDSESKKHKIIYDDGEEEHLILENETYELVPDRSSRRTASKPNYKMIVDDDSEQEFDDENTNQKDEEFKVDEPEQQSDEGDWMDELSDDGTEGKPQKKRLSKSKTAPASSKKPKINDTPTRAASFNTVKSPPNSLGKSLDAFRSPTASKFSGEKKLTPVDKELASSTKKPRPSTAGGKEETSAKPDAVWLRDGVLNLGRHLHDDWPWLHAERKDKQRRKPGDPGYDPRTLFVPPAALAKETPAMQQWWKFKSENMDTVLFFKVGKFYELFHMDADVGMKELDLIYMKGEKAHSGFPEIAYGKFSAALVAKGYKVARVEQTETPEMMKDRNSRSSGAKSKVVNRELCSVLTRGTRTFCYMDQFATDMEFDPSANILLVIKEKPLMEDSSGARLGAAEGKGETVPPVCEIGVCVVNAPTSNFLLGQFADGPLRSRLRTLLTQMPPVEVLAQAENLSNLTLSMLRNSGRMPNIEVLREQDEFWGPRETIKKLKKGKYFPSESKQEQDDEDTSNSGTGRWPAVVKALAEGGEDGELALSCLGASTFWLQRSLIDHDLLTMQKFGAYIPPDLEGPAPSDQPSPTTLLAAAQQQHASAQTPSGGLAQGSRNMVLDGNALANLEVLRNNTDGKEKGSLWEHMNKCATAFGRRMLREWMVKPLLHIPDIERRLEAVEELCGPLSVEAIQAKSVLAKLPDVERLLARVHSMGSKHRSQEHPESRAILYEEVTYGQKKIKDFSLALQALRLIQGIPELFKGKDIRSTYLKKILNYQSEGGNFPLLSQLLDHFEEVFDAKQAEKDGFITARPGVDPEYDIAHEKITGIQNELNSFLKKQQQEIGCRNLKYWGKNKDRYQIEVPVDALKKGQPAGYELKSQKKGFKRFRTAYLNKTVQDLEKAEAALDVAKKDHLRKIFQHFDNSYDVWVSAVNCIAHLDAIQSLAEVASYPGYSKPEFTSSPGAFLQLEAARHPCIAHTFQGTFIPNDTVLGTVPGSMVESPRMMLLSGPNMGGKSTLLRQTCLIAIMAQMGSFVPAERCLMTPVDRIFTRLGATDRILAGESTFFVELGEAATILHSATKDSLVILDELGRGTSTFDGTAIAHAVVENLAAKGCRTMFATHYHSLVEDWSHAPSVMLGHMACFVEPDGKDQQVTFLYKLTPGSSPKSYGLNVARLARLPQQVLQIAQEKSSEFEQLMAAQSSLGCAHHELGKQVLEILSAVALSDEEKGEQLLKVWARSNQIG